MTIKGILFDADGVVINSENFSVQYQKRFGISNDEMLPFFKGNFQDCIVGKADLVNEIKPWLSKWKWTGSVDEFLQFWFNAEHNTDNRLVLMIKKFRKNGIKCFLATNQEKYRTQYMKTNMGFEKLFDHVFSSAEIGFKKPSREFYASIVNELKKQGISPDELMFFDDSTTNVEEARKIGIDAQLYENFEGFEQRMVRVLERDKS
jgi:putative hydrolase of the HAD superfamily